MSEPESPSQTNQADMPRSTPILDITGERAPTAVAGEVSGTAAGEIIAYLKDQARMILKDAKGLHTLVAFSPTAQGDFYYNWQDSVNVTYFNWNTYQWINSSIAAGSNPIQIDNNFANRFELARASLSYGLSTSDQAALTEANTNATQQIGALQNAWISAFGALPPNPTTGSTTTTPVDNIMGIVTQQWANPPTTLQMMKQARNLSQLLNTQPASAAPVIPVIAQYLNAISSVISLVNSTSTANYYMGVVQSNIQSPTKESGGLQTNNQSRFVPAYLISPAAGVIQSALRSKTDPPPIRLMMSVSRDTTDQLTVSITGGASFRIPVTSFLGLNVGGSASFFSDNLATTSTTTTVEMSFPGVNFVNFGPAPYDMATGTNWYWIDPIREAIQKKGTDYTGWKFTPDSRIDFSKNGSFGYLSGVAICTYPTIVITVITSDYQRLQQTLNQQSTVGVTFLGIPLGGVTQATYKNNVSVDAQNSSVVITLEPPAQVVASPANSAQAWVLGVQPEFPCAG